MASNAKAAKEKIILEMIIELESGADRSSLLATNGKSWQLSVRTFDRYWKEAQERFTNGVKSRQQLVQEQSDLAAVARIGKAIITKDQTLESLSEIATADLKQYFRIGKSVRRDKTSIPLAVHVENLKEEIENVEYYHSIALAQDLLGSGKKLDAAVAKHEDQIRRMKLELIPLEVKLAKDPQATVIVDTAPELVEVAELDIARLVQAQESGKIKSFQATDSGVKVEMYPADAALRDLAKHYGLFEKDNQQKSMNLKVGFGNDTD